MRVTALLVGEIIAVVNDDQIDDRTVRQIVIRPVENKPHVLDACAQWTHAAD